ncbi:MAG: hypothetical protein QM727_01165 [Niabella sp.]
MKKTFFLLWIIAGLLTACGNNNNKQPESENDLEAARNFIEAALKGKYDMSRNFMLQDTENLERLDAVSRVQLSSSEKQGLWDASIKIINRHLVNDSTSIIIYSNSFHPENTDTLKVVKLDGKWLVDFKYLFNHDQPDVPPTLNDSTTTKP